MSACLLLFGCFLAPGPFSGVTVENITDTPLLTARAVVEYVGAAIAEHGQGMEEADGAVTAADGFRLDLQAQLDVGVYVLEVDCAAPDGGTDSFWIEVNGERDPRPMVLPQRVMETARAPIRVEGPGLQEIRLVLREAPGVVIKRVALAAVTTEVPRAPMAGERAAMHPRLLLYGDMIPQLQARMATGAGQRHYRLAGLAPQTPPTYDPQRRTCGRYRSLPTYAMAHLLDPSPKRLARITRWLEEALTFDEWGHGSLADLDLDAAYMMEGLALCYDWLYDELPEDLRARLRDNIAEHCRILYQASLGGRTGGSLAFQQNHYWFAHLVLGLGAGAIYGEVPEAERWLAWAWDRFERVFLTLGDDGGFHEGPSYYDFSMPPLFLMIDLYEQLSGLPIPYGDEGLRKSAVFRLHHQYPRLDLCASLEDTPITKEGPATWLMLWLARRYQDPVTQGIAEWLTTEPNSHWWNLLALDPEIEAADATAAIATAAYYDDVEMAFARTSWEPDATMFAFVCRPLGGHKYAEICEQFGLGGTGHNHPAQGHYVLFGRGEILAADPGYTYEKKTANHNTVLVDGRGQFADGQMWPAPTPGRAFITGFTHEGDVTIVSADATSAYPPELGLERFERTLVMAGPDLVVICDRLRAKQPRTLQWRHHFYGDGAAIDGGWLLKVGDAQLLVLPRLPQGVSGKLLEESPVYVHPERDLTPEQSVIDVLQLSTEPTTEATFVVPLVVGNAGEPAPAVRTESNEGRDRIEIGDTVIEFTRTGAVRVERDGRAIELEGR